MGVSLGVRTSSQNIKISCCRKPLNFKLKKKLKIKICKGFPLQMGSYTGISLGYGLAFGLISVVCPFHTNKDSIPLMPIHLKYPGNSIPNN
jgi:hypothetical protein